MTDSEQEKKDNSLDPFSFMKVGVTPESKLARKIHDNEKFASIFLLPIMIIWATIFIVIYSQLETDNCILFVGLYFITFTLAQQKLGVAFSINPLAPIIGEKLHYKSGNKNMFEVSLWGQIVFGIIFILIGVFFH